MKTMVNSQANIPAFPGTEPYECRASFTGLTKREYFAALAMQGILASHIENDPSAGDVARLAISYADGLIEELNKIT